MSWALLSHQDTVVKRLTRKILVFLVLIFLWKGQKVNRMYKPVNNQILSSAMQVIEQLAPLD